MQTVSVFVDVQNIFYTTKQEYGCNFNYNIFWKTVTSGRTVVKAIAYAIDRGDEKQKQFQNILRGIGFEVKLKPFISRKDGSSKGDWDVGITIDIMECAQESDVIVLASGDGDFDLLIQNIKTRHNTLSEIYGVRALTSNSLINSASKFIPIEGDLLLK
ncbi:MAG: NYN domain-containing protein [Proteobacteria bacterium]|nr:NYN domain-containing protein [Pseudomonadota bacterium]